MPGHFTHIYTARRVADHLLTFDGWPEDLPEFAFSPQECANAMIEWEKFTAIGAIGPDLFYFSQDYNSLPLGPLSDELMLSLATYYFFDAAKEDDWEPLLIILDKVNSTMAALLRFLIKLQKIWDAFVADWNRTIGPLVAPIAGLPDALTGGLISEFGVALGELKVALKLVAEEELATFKDIFTLFDTCVQKGFDEKAFLWSDMSHYRRPSTLCRSLVKQAIALKGGPDGEKRSQQFLAFALGYITHVGTDTVAHSFVNEQCGGPYRNHPQRHHLIENHIDAWNYSETGPKGRITPDPWGTNPTYPDLSMSALWFAVQMTPADPKGKQRPDPLPADPADRKKALDVDGEMPGWMADSIVLALKDTFPNDNDHPRIYGGSDFQSAINGPLLNRIVNEVTGHGLDRPFQELLDDIAPKPAFDVPHGFPLPWQIQTMYRIMITFYKLQFNANWELQKPQKPDFIILPPASDIENLLQPPDFSGVDSSNPVVDICEAIKALVDWAVKELEAAAKLAEDLVKMLVSPSTYLLRLGLYELAMMVWDVITKTHEILAHTGFFAPHSEQHYDGGELRLPSELDIPLITLGGTVDSAFRQALAAAIDPLGNLDRDQSPIGTSHSVLDPNYPYYPVLRLHLNAGGTVETPPEAWEFRRPWAYPNLSLLARAGKDDTLIPTRTETYDPSKSDPIAAAGAYKPLRPGPYPIGAMPDVFFRTNIPVDGEARSAYETAQTPAATDRLNEEHLTQRRLQTNPLGDPIPFSAHLIAQLANDTGYSTQFNLDSDRAFAYLTWDWIRKDPKGEDPTATNVTGTYLKPVVPPEGAPGWDLGVRPLQLKYVDPPSSGEILLRGLAKAEDGNKPEPGGPK